MPVCPLAPHANLEHLKNQAKVVQRAVRAGDPWGLALVAEFHPRRSAVVQDPARRATFSRADAQHVVARQHGLASWRELRRHLDVVTAHARSPHLVGGGGPLETAADRVAAFLRLACLNYGDDHPRRREQAARLLERHPEIATSDIWTMAAVGEAEAAAALLAEEPALATAEGGPFRWPALLYLAYSRVDGGPGRSALATATVLLDAGADPNSGFLWEGLSPPFTALTGAFGEGEGGRVNQPRHPDSLALARLLLRAGADPNDGQTLYNRHFGADDDHLRLLLASGLGTGSGGPWKALLGDTLPSPREMVADELAQAVADDRPERVRLLLDHAAPIREGLVRRALLDGSTTVADHLREAGADPVQLTPAEALVAACMAADVDQVTRLASDPALAAAAIAARPDAVRRAAELGRASAVPLLVRVGFDLDAVHRTSALHEAAWRGDVQLIRLLLYLGADPRVRDAIHGTTPLRWARHAGREAAAALLEGAEGHDRPGAG